jgi:N-acyl-D-aspartate/D-glutamate deacylase
LAVHVAAAATALTDCSNWSLGGRAMDADLIIRGGTVVDGTGAPARRADVAIVGDRIAAVENDLDARATRELDAEGRVVTPGFVDVHTHLDAQLGWDPLPTSSCWHGITSVVLGNCGVTFAPVGPGQREFLAEMMESVEDIPREAILGGLPWDWTTYGDYLRWLDRIPKGMNVGGLVGHCALRVAAMGDRCMAEGSGTPDDIALMCDMAEEALQSGALGISTSRTLGHVVPDGRPVPARGPAPTSCSRSARCCGGVGAACSRARCVSVSVTTMRSPALAPRSRSWGRSAAARDAPSATGWCSRIAGRTCTRR